MTGRELFDLQKAMVQGERLTDAQVRTLADLRRQENVGRRFVQVGKLALRPGEELMEFVNVMMGAVFTDRIVLADGSLDAWLEGIYEDHVIVSDRNTGRLFRADFTRGPDGSVKFADPVQVMVQYVPVETSTEDKGEAAEKVAKAIEIPRKDSRWGFLPPSLSGR